MTAWGGGGGVGICFVVYCKAGFRDVYRKFSCFTVVSVALMELWMPCMEVEKLQMSSANCIDGTGRSWSIGGSQLDLEAKMMSAINRLNSSGDSGSPCLRPMDVAKGWPSLAPSLIQEDALMYMFSTSLQNCRPSPHIIIFRNRRGRLTLSYAFCRLIKAA